VLRHREAENSCRLPDRNEFEMRDGTRNSATRPQTPMRLLCLRVVLAFMLAVLVVPALPAFAQRPRAETRSERRAERRQEVRQARRMRIRRAMRARFFARLRDLPPKEQERVLKNDRRFQQLPEARRKQIRENLKHWNQLSPKQKQQIRKREQIYSQLTPEQRQNVRRMSGEWRNLRPAERMHVRLALRRMRGMTPEERQKFLDSPEFHQRFSSEEQNILRGLERLFPGGGAPEQ